MLDQRFMTHLPALFSALLNSEGPVLEIGAGFGSTPMLKAFCDATDRKFLSFESNPHWALAMKQHGTFFSDDYRALEQISGPLWPAFGVVFVDHAPEQDRIRTANLFRGKARFVVIHDWSSADTSAHGSLEGWAQIKVDERFFPSTIILSMGDIPF